jgi:hypothetical protein
MSYRVFDTKQNEAGLSLEVTDIINM